MESRLERLGETMGRSQLEVEPILKESVLEDLFGKKSPLRRDKGRNRHHKKISSPRGVIQRGQNLEVLVAALGDRFGTSHQTDLSKGARDSKVA